jgi:nuclear GTP-binding protein
MKLKRHSSKRVPLARKYNLEKKVKAHHKKLKKHATTLKKSGVLANKKRAASASSIAIPNAWPHKRELLAELQQKKEAAIQEKLEARRRRKAGLAEPVMSIDTTVDSYEDMMAKSAERARQFEISTNGTRALEESLRTVAAETSEIAQTRKKFYDDLVKVTNTADVVLVVLDARDPQSCRSEKLETDIRANGKRLVFLLNKIDLVPAEAVEAWLAFYRKIAPTIAFKACLTGAGKAARKTPLTMGPIRGNEEIYQASSANYGADKLIQLLKQYSRNGIATGSLTVGIVGFPNVGKSSIINTLMGLRRGTGSSSSGHVKTGNHAGVTSQLQEVQLDNKITLIDSAGVVFPSSIGTNDASLVLRRAINVDSLRDPVGTVGRVLNHRGVTVDSLCQILRVPTFANAMELIRNVAQVHGKVKRGGGADMEASAKFILNRVSDGKSHFYTMPPASEGPAGGFAFVVNEFKPELDLNALEASGAIME